MPDQSHVQYIKTTVSYFLTNYHRFFSLAGDLLWVVTIVGSVALVLFLICGTWPAIVAIESKSMDPHMKMGDLVVVVQKDRYGAFQTWDQGFASTYEKFGDYGDVIIYKPNGMTTVHPIIHRAIIFTAGEPLSSLRGSKLNKNYSAPHPGYITWGDNNLNPDQFSSLNNIGAVEPVRDEWIVGKAFFSVPLVGYLPLHVVELSIILVILMALHELYFRSRKKKENSKKKK